MSDVQEIYVKAVGSAKDTHRLSQLMWQNKPLARFASVLLVVSFLVIVVNVISFLLAPHSAIAAEIFDLFNIMTDHGLSEKYGHGLSFAASAAFLMGYFTFQRRILLFAHFLFGFIWFDDAAQYHEKFGVVLADTLDLPTIGGLRAQDTGEMLAWALAAFVLLPIGLWAWRNRTAGDGAVFVILLFILAAFGVFGVAVDMVHVLAEPGSGEAVGFLEDGGELLAQSVAAVFAIGILQIGDIYFEDSP